MMDKRQHIIILTMSILIFVLMVIDVFIIKSKPNKRNTPVIVNHESNIHSDECNPVNMTVMRQQHTCCQYESYVDTTYMDRNFLYIDGMQYYLVTIDDMISMQSVRSISELEYTCNVGD